VVRYRLAGGWAVPVRTTSAVPSSTRLFSGNYLLRPTKSGPGVAGGTRNDSLQLRISSAIVTRQWETFVAAGALPRTYRIA